MIRFLFLGLFFITAQIGSSQTKFISDKKGVITYCDAFMQKILDNKIDEAIQTLKENSAIEPEEIDKLGVMMNTQWKRIGDSYVKSFRLNSLMKRA
jgi:hypothetical protein